MGKGVTGEIQRRLETLFSPSHSDELDLPDLHKALMGLSGRTLDAAVDLTGRSAIDAVDASGRTALSWAAQRGDDSALSRLLMCGADPNIADLNGKTPLHWGASAGKVQCVQNLLLAKADIEARHRSGFTPLCFAVRSGSVETLEILLADRADSLSALNVAIWYNRSKAHPVLLDQMTGLEISRLPASAVRHALSRKNYNLLAILFQHSDLEAMTKQDGLDILYDVVNWADTKSVLVLLTHLKTLGKDFSADDVDNLRRYAQWRRDHNRLWPEVKVAQPNEDPDTWYNTFEALVSRNRKTEYTSGECEIQKPQGDESYDTDAEDTWEDAQERLPQRIVRAT